MLSVILPTLNEAASLPGVISELKNALQNTREFEIIVVDDDSQDRTWQVAETLAESDPRIRVLRRTSKPGLSASVIDGIRFAKGEFVACMDADGQHDPAVLLEMLKALESGADIAVGSRYTSAGSVGEWGLVRRKGSSVATKLALRIMGLSLGDPLSGFFASRRTYLLRAIDRAHPQGFKILLEILAAGNKPVIVEVPITFRPRVAGDSKMSSHVALEYIRQLWRLRRLC